MAYADELKLRASVAKLSGVHAAAARLGVVVQGVRESEGDHCEIFVNEVACGCGERRAQSWAF
jgi:hypothetical protein